MTRGNLMMSVLAVGASLSAAAIALGAGAGTGFVYQGQLRTTASHSRVNGDTDFKFSLWDAETGGTQIGITLEFSVDPNAVGLPIAVSKGLFQAELEFGAGAFDGNERWLAIEIRHPSDPTDTLPFDPISARQKLNPAPYAVYSVGQSTLSAPDGDPPDAVIVNTNGNVGVGIPYAAYPLHVARSSPGTPLAVFQQGDSSAYGVSITPGNDTAPFYALRISNREDTADRHVFRGDGRALLALGGGNVGIGTASPAYTLSVNGEAGMNSIRVPNVTSGTSLQVLRDPNSGDEAIVFRVVGGGYTDYRLQLGRDAGTNHVYVPGNLGIGTRDPGYPLEVVGNAAKNTGDLWTVSSDARLKKNVRTLDGALDRVLALRGVTFEWIEPEQVGGLKGTQIGLIAQEVEQVFPEWVGEDQDGYKNVTVRGLTALTVESLRELKTENDALRAEVRELRELVTQLAERVEGIQTTEDRPADSQGR